MRFEAAGDIEALCKQKVPEGLSLEFKEKEDHESPLLSKIDKRSIAETLSAFANSDGGTLIFGIRTEKSQGVDVATEIRPISEVEICRASVELVCAANISPNARNLTVRAIETSASFGVIVCTVGRSELRPHMCTAQNVHRFLRRGFEGNALMTPSEIKDQFLAVRDAILEPIIQGPRCGMSTATQHWISGQASTRFLLKNIGRALCRNPFLRVGANCKLYSNLDGFSGELGAWKTDFPYGTMIHVEDQKSCLNLKLNFIVRLDILNNLFFANEPDLSDSVLVLPGSSDWRTTTITDKVSLDGVKFELVFGAENASATSSSIFIDRASIAASILSEETTAKHFMSFMGPWRGDAVERFRASLADRIAG